MRSGAYDEALAILDEQLAQTPERIGILVQKAAALGLSGKHSEALAISDEYSAWHVDLLATGSEPDTFLYLKYYADEDFREYWLAEFPDYQLPDHESPHFDPDAPLPRPSYDSITTEPGSP